MATEGPLFHDGSMMTAFANYYNPGSALAGPGGSGQFLFVSVQGSRVIQVNTSSGALCYGVLQNTPLAGDAADVAFFGPGKIVAGASITAGAEIMSDASGRAITWTAGSDKYKMGIALETTSAAGNIFTAFIYPGQQGST